jgi:hypothetical protein
MTVLGGIVECTSLGQPPPSDSDSISLEFHPRELHVYMDSDGSTVQLTLRRHDKATAIAGVLLTPEQTWELTAILDMCARDCNGGWPDA